MVWIKAYLDILNNLGTDHKCDRLTDGQTHILIPYAMLTYNAEPKSYNYEQNYKTAATNRHIKTDFVCTVRTLQIYLLLYFYYIKGLWRYHIKTFSCWILLWLYATVNWHTLRLKSGKPRLWYGNDWSSTMCQWNTFILLYAIASLWQMAKINFKKFKYQL